MTIISPSLLACDFLNIESELKHFTDFKGIWFHLDIMDGHFVPNLTFGHPIVNLISKKTNILLDAHFMVSNPKFYIDSFKDYNIHNFTFHVESTQNQKELLSLIDEAKLIYKSVGISIKPGTEVSTISLDVWKKLDLILLMSVEPGFGGQSFIENTYTKLDQINKIIETNNLNLMIQVDGGVSDANASKLIKHGSTNLVAGSYIFKDGPSSYSQKIENLRKQ